MSSEARVIPLWPAAVAGAQPMSPAAAEGDRALLLRAGAGDEKACRELIDRHGTRLLQIVRATHGDLGIGEDIVQEAFIRALGQGEQLREEASMFPWLVRIALRVALDYRRKIRRETLTETFKERGEERAPSPELAFEEREVSDRVRSALEQLKPYPKQLMVLRYFASLSVAELAGVFGKSEVAIRKDLQRARDRVRGLLEGDAR